MVRPLHAVGLVGIHKIHPAKSPIASEIDGWRRGKIDSGEIYTAIMDNGGVRSCTGDKREGEKKSGK